MKTNSLARYLVNPLRIVKGKFTVLYAPENTPKKTARTSNTVSLKVSRTSERILRGQPILSKLEVTMIVGIREEGATTAMMIETTILAIIRTITPITRDKVRDATTKIDLVTTTERGTTEIRDSPKLILNLLNTSHGAKM
jgi:hypothetical protein